LLTNAQFKIIIMTTTKTVASKAFVAIVAAAMVFSLVAPAAKAATAEELQAQIATLMAQIAALSGGTTATAPAAGAYTFTRSLTIGSTGADVTALQNYLISKGFTIAAGATGYFGAQTASAVAAWQTANGITPAAGFFGPVSQAKYMALMAAAPVTPTTPTGTTTTPTTPSTSLGNDEGSLDNFDEVSSDDSNINEGETGEVFAFTTEVEGDVEIDRVDFYMDTAATSSDASDYFEEAYLMVDGEKVATLDVSDFDEDDYANVAVGSGDEYRLRFSDLSIVLADGDEPEFTVAFKANNSIDSGDLTTDWTIDLETDSVRYTDGKGYTDSVGSALSESFGFEAEEVAQLDITKSSDSPDGTTVEVDDKDTSSQIEIFKFDISEENGVDVTVNDLTMTASTTKIDVTSTIDRVVLYVGGKEVGSETPAANGSMTFENLKIEVDADATVEVTAKVIFNGTEDYTEGDSAFLTFNAVTDSEDANGNKDGDITGSNPTDFSSDTFSLRSEGIALELTSIDEVKDGASFSGDKDTGTYTFKFNVKSFGENFYMDEAVANVTYDLLVGGVAAPSASSTATLDISGADTAGVADFKISKGDDNVTLTLTVETAASVVGSTKVLLKTVRYSAGDDATEELTENAVPATDWTSDSLILN
jgi:peptidoglycan hydrolase-like protein with peptidoglycan-binding domain